MNKHITLATTVALLGSLLCLTACDDDTASMGIYSDADAIASSSEQFQITSCSVLVDSVMANSSRSYLGQVNDPETGATLRAEFAAQFHTFENYTVPDEEQLIHDEDGDVIADSVDVRLYFNSYYGDADNPMKVSVYELDITNVLREDWTYYSDINISSYLPAEAEPLASKLFTAEDYTLTSEERSSTSYNAHVRIKLPVSYGTSILRMAVHHPEYFRDSWQFIHHVCPGFYFKLESGEGTLLSISVSTLNVYFRYHDLQEDSTYVGISRFAATPEVIQSTHFDNDGLEALLDASQPYTYLKAPAALATELTLPVDEIFAGHEQDSINRARVILTRYNVMQSDYAFGTPSQVLMLPASRAVSFFQNREVPDGETSFVSSFDSSYNTYTFSNIARLLSYLHRQKQKGMKEEGLSSEAWNSAHPDWNRVRVIPVTTTTATNSTTGLSYYSKVNHDLSLSSIRLVGGSQPLDMQVIYSRYK